MVNELSELISILSLPLGWAALHFPHLDLFEAFMVPIIPLEDVLHASGLLSLVPSLPCMLGLELGQLLLHQVELYYLLRIWSSEADCLSVRLQAV